MIELSPKVMIGIAVFFVFAFIGIIIYSSSTQPNYIKITEKISFDTTNIDSRPDHGWIIINDSMIINSSAKLVGSSDGFNDWAFNIDKSHHVHTLSDLPIRYKIFKKANNDTVMAKINGKTLKFLIAHTISPDR